MEVQFSLMYMETDEDARASADGAMTGLIGRGTRARTATRASVERAGEHPNARTRTQTFYRTHSLARGVGSPIDVARIVDSVDARIEDGPSRDDDGRRRRARATRRR